MKQKIEAFYLKRLTFIVFTLVAFISWIAWAVYNYANNNFKLGSFSLIFAALVAFLFWAYKKGESNIQKMLLGGLLTFLIVDYVSIFSDYVANKYVDSMIYALIVIVLLSIVFISHMIQQSDHTGETKGGIINQCCGFITIILLLWDVYKVIMGTATLSALFWTISIAATIGMIISIETRVQKYKEIRKLKLNGGSWTEEDKAKARELFRL